MSAKLERKFDVHLRNLILLKVYFVHIISVCVLCFLFMYYSIQLVAFSFLFYFATCCRICPGE